MLTIKKGGAGVALPFLLTSRVIAGLSEFPAVGEVEVHIIRVFEHRHLGWVGLGGFSGFMPQVRAVCEHTSLEFARVDSFD